MPKTLAREKQESRYVEISAPRNTGPWKHPVLIGTPTLGLVRIEWHNSITNMVIPINFMTGFMSPIGFHVADGQNLVCKELMDKSYEWMFLLEDDVVPPCNLYLKFQNYVAKKTIPVISGLYALKSTPPLPLLFRGKGNGAFTDFKLGSKFWVDGVPTGCLLIHASIIHEMAKTAEDYEVSLNGQKVKLKKIFETPRKVFVDPELGTYNKMVGTSDLHWCDNVIKNKILEKSGWKKVGARDYPFYVDTEIHCGHVDRDTGMVYQWNGEKLKK